MGRCVHEQASSVAPGRLVSVARWAVRGPLGTVRPRGAAGRRTQREPVVEWGGWWRLLPDPGPPASQGSLRGDPRSRPTGARGPPWPTEGGSARPGRVCTPDREAGRRWRACLPTWGRDRGCLPPGSAGGGHCAGGEGLLWPRRGLPGGLWAKVQKREASRGAAPVCLGAEWYRYFLPHEACVQGGVGGGVPPELSLPACRGGRRALPTPCALHRSLSSFVLVPCPGMSSCVPGTGCFRRAETLPSLRRCPGFEKLRARPQDKDRIYHYSPRVCVPLASSAWRPSLAACFCVAPRRSHSWLLPRFFAASSSGRAQGPSALSSALIRTVQIMR